MIEVEGFGGIRHLLTAPGSHVFALNPFSNDCEPFLDKQDLRVVIGEFSEDITTTSPWGDDVKRNTESCSASIELSTNALQVE
jgi:hypothetical protein